MRGQTALAAAGVAGLVLTGVAFVVVLSGVAEDPPQPQDLLPPLVATAGLCVAALLNRRNPSGAWLATIAALTVATLSLAAWGRDVRATLESAGWMLLVVTVCAGALFATGSAVRYATEPSRMPAKWVRPLGVVAMIVVVATCGWVS